MSDRYVHSFSFGLKPDLPGALSVFQALARGERPTDGALASLPTGLAEFLTTPEGLVEERPFVGAPVLVWETGIQNDPSKEWHAPSPTHYVRFVVVMHDDWFAGGGYALPYLVFDLVQDHELFCVEWTEGQADRITHYFKEFDDVVVASLRTPGFAFPLPPAASDVATHLPHWKPARPEDFSVDVRRITTPERQELLRDL